MSPVFEFEDDGWVAIYLFAGFFVGAAIVLFGGDDAAVWFEVVFDFVPFGEELFGVAAPDCVVEDEF